MKETRKFEQWYASEKKEGLVDIKFVPGDSIKKDTTREEFAVENNWVNELIAGEEFVERPDVF
jgi:hypothetical protein